MRPVGRLTRTNGIRMNSRGLAHLQAGISIRQVPSVPIALRSAVFRSPRKSAGVALKPKRFSSGQCRDLSGRHAAIAIRATAPGECRMTLQGAFRLSSVRRAVGGDLDKSSKRSLVGHSRYRAFARVLSTNELACGVTMPGLGPQSLPKLLRMARANKVALGR